MTGASLRVDASLPSPADKLAPKVANRIVRDIVRGGWAVGTVLGSEAELLERYDVSRAVFREAVRLLEHLGVASTRRGSGGGLVITQPSTAGVIQAFVVYLTYIGMTLGELTEARVSLERTIARLAAQRADESEIELMRERVVADKERTVLNAEDHHILHTMIGASTKNPAAVLFVDVLGRLTARFVDTVVTTEARSEELAASARAHNAIVEAITAGNVALAERRMSTHLVSLGDSLGRHRQSPPSLDWVLGGEAGDQKLGSRVARSIMVDIVDRDWPIGQVIGSEPELLERYQISRAALREAVRILEYHQVATMKRGPRGGLVVTTPSVEPIVRAAAVFLEHRGITARDLIDLRRDLESDAVALAIERAPDVALAGLRATLATESEAAFDAHAGDELHVRIAELTGNPAIALFVNVLVELTRAHASVPARDYERRAAIKRETDHAHQQIVDALVRRDPALARRRVVRHLDALEPSLR